MNRIVFLLIGVLAGCGAEGETAQYDESVASLSFTGDRVYDAGTLCTVGGHTMHCCEAGWAMIGVHLAQNVFKCAKLTSTAGDRFLDVGTIRNAMHACPRGTVMVGYHDNDNLLACETPVPDVSDEFVDGNPLLNDGFPMHVCPDSYAMAGIHTGHNQFTCAK